MSSLELRLTYGDGPAPMDIDSQEPSNILPPVVALPQPQQPVLHQQQQHVQAIQTGNANGKQDEEQHRRNVITAMCRSAKIILYMNFKQYLSRNSDGQSRCACCGDEMKLPLPNDSILILHPPHTLIRLAGQWYGNKCMQDEKQRQPAREREPFIMPRPEHIRNPNTEQAEFNGDQGQVLCFMRNWISDFRCLTRGIASPTDDTTTIPQPREYRTVICCATCSTRLQQIRQLHSNDFYLVTTTTSVL